MIDVRPFEWLPERITRAENTARARKVRFSFKTEEGATESDLLTLEAKIGMPLPKSYRQFLLLSRFAILEWESPKSGGIIKTVRLEDMLETLTELRKDADEAYANGIPQARWGQLLPVVDTLNGNFLVADPESCTKDDACIFYADHEEAPESWRKFAFAAASFELLLMRVFDELGFKQCNPMFWNRFTMRNFPL